MALRSLRVFRLVNHAHPGSAQLFEGAATRNGAADQLQREARWLRLSADRRKSCRNSRDIPPTFTLEVCSRVLPHARDDATARFEAALLGTKRVIRSRP